MNFKRGDTIYFYANIKNKETGLPVDISEEDMRAQLRQKDGTLIDEFTITETETTGKYLFEGQEDSNEYPLGKLYFDVEIDREGFIRSTVTATITIDKDETLPVEV